MGRKRSIIIDCSALLTAIASDICDDVAAIDAELSQLQGDGNTAWTPFGYRSHRSYLLRLREDSFSVEQNLSRWAGRPLTDSERIRHQQAVRQLEADGLIVRDGRQVSLTPAGWQRCGMTPPNSI